MGPRRVSRAERGRRGGAWRQWHAVPLPAHAREPGGTHEHGQAAASVASTHARRESHMGFALLGLPRLACQFNFAACTCTCCVLRAVCACACVVRAPPPPPPRLASC